MIGANKKELLQHERTHYKEKIKDGDTQNLKRMEINEAARNPMLGELASIQEGATGLEDSGGNTMNQKKWKQLAREKCETVSDGNQNLGKRDGDMDVDECSERKKIRLGRMGNLPWIVLGDFNEILHLDEKQGGVTRSNITMSPFKEAIDDCALLDIGYVGNKYTRSNRQFKGDLIQEKLDRASCCLEWRTTFPNAIVLHKEWVGSYHKLL
ncbi:hypothetical protein Q3G72_006391 [Acer saccharum]|nr:hypothetical protein Q3G72_006391 [Acer saccharum]